MTSKHWLSGALALGTVLVAMGTPPAAGAAPSAPPTTEIKRIVVFPFRVTSGIDPSKGRLVDDMFLTELARVTPKGMIVLSSTDIETMLGQIAQKQMVGCDDTACLVEIGNAMGASHMISSSLGKLGDKHVITTKLLDVQNARVLHRDTLYLGAAEEEIPSGLRKMARKMATRFGWDNERRADAETLAATEASKAEAEQAAMAAAALEAEQAQQREEAVRAEEEQRQREEAARTEEKQREETAQVEEENRRTKAEKVAEAEREQRQKELERAARTGGYNNSQIVKTFNTLAEELEVPDKEREVLKKQLRKKFASGLYQQTVKHRAVKAVFVYKATEGGLLVSFMKGRGLITFNKGLRAAPIMLESWSAGALAGGSTQWGIGLVMGLRDPDHFGGEYSGDVSAAAAPDTRRSSEVLLSFSRDRRGERSHDVLLITVAKGLSAGVAVTKLTIKPRW